MWPNLQLISVIHSWWNNLYDLHERVYSFRKHSQGERGKSAVFVYQQCVGLLWGSDHLERNTAGDIIQQVFKCIGKVLMFKLKEIARGRFVNKEEKKVIEDVQTE